MRRESRRICTQRQTSGDARQLSQGPRPRVAQAHVSGQWHRPLVVLWGAVGVILLIACVNLSNLMLVRAAARSKELAVRGALGATRARLVRQSLTESLALSGAGAALGLASAFAIVRWLAHRDDLDLPLLNAVTIDAAAVAWTIIVAVVAAGLFGLVPALKMAGDNVQEALKDSGPAADAATGTAASYRSGDFGDRWPACCCSWGRTAPPPFPQCEVDLGFAPDRAATIAVDYNDDGSSGEMRAARRSATFQNILERVRALPERRDGRHFGLPAAGPNRSWGTLAPKGKIFALAKCRHRSYTS